MCGNESQEFRSLPLPHHGNNKRSSRKRARTKSMTSIVGKAGTSQPHSDSLRRVTKRRKREAGKSQRIKKTSKEDDNKLKETFNENNKEKDDYLAVCKRKYIIDDMDNKYLENKLDGEENKNDKEDNLDEKKNDKERFDRYEKEDCEKVLKLGNLFFKGHIKTSNEDLNEMNNIFRAETLLQSIFDSEDFNKDRDNEKDITGSLGNKLVEKKNKREVVDDRDMKKQNGVTLERRGSGEWRSIQQNRVTLERRGLGEWRSIQHLSKSRESVLEESDGKLYVYIPAGDNRLAEERVEEETSLKTRLLTLDLDRKKEEEENKEKEDSAPEDLKKSFYAKFHSTNLQEGEENCRSFISDNSDGQNGIENSFYSQSDLPSQEASSDDDNSYDKSSTSWDEFRSKEDSEKDEREKLDTDMNFMSLSPNELKEDQSIIDDKLQEAGELTGRRRHNIEEDCCEELSEKEKLSLDDEKDIECVADETDNNQVREDTDQTDEDQARVDNDQTDANQATEVNAGTIEMLSGKISVHLEGVKSLAVGGVGYENEVESSDENNLEEVQKSVHSEPIVDTESGKKSIKEKNVPRKQLNILQMRRQMEESRDFENDYMPILMNSVDSVERKAWEWSICIMCSECRDFQQSLKTTVCKRKRRKRPDVKLPRLYTGPCKPKRGGNSGRWSRFLQAGWSCRTCSYGGTGHRSDAYSWNSARSSKKDSRDEDGAGRRDRNNNGFGNNDNNGRDERNGNGGGDRRRKISGSVHSLEDESNVPEQDYKRYRKKHNNVSFDDFTAYLGALGTFIEESKGPVWDGIVNLIPDCLVTSLEKPDELSEDLLNCDICTILNSMLKHFADCPEQYLSCTMCIQMFSFVCMHAYDCRKNRYACQIALCVKFHHVLRDDTIENQVKRLWRIIKKKLACVLGFDDGIMTSTSFVPINPPTHHSIGIGAMHHSHTSLASIPENSEGRTSRPGSQVLTRKRSNKLPSVPESEALAWGSGHVELSDTVPLPDTTRLSDTARLSDTRRLSDSTRLADTMRSDTTRLADTMRSDTTRLPDTMTAEMPDKTRVADTIAAPVPMPTVPAKHPMVRKISASRFVSLPVGGGTEGQQFPSYTFQPVGRPGICEVMYGIVKQLIAVGKNWSELKDMFLRGETLPRPYREEGIILKPYKEYLVIDVIRYQLEFQWLKVSHLGNGMSGKCHLATDFQTDFKFCVKEIHIRNFEVEEIELWSDLDHPYIVKLYGAIRHGEMIYIFSEFIDGGNLTEAINTQRSLNRRLSHTTALLLFQQLLQVLIYFKQKNILHEDLKADNILLCREKDSISIKVTDFGLATRINIVEKFRTKPVGTMTQWSPEKAECVSYGYPAEVWAAVCVLVHMLSGLPPWMRRYGGFKSLIVVIVQQSPPIEDFPRNVPKSVRDLIERGFTVCHGQRPTAEDLLKHEAFKLITNTNQRNDTYSILDSTFHPNNTELEHKNADLQDIINGLEKNMRRTDRYLSDNQDNITLRQGSLPRPQGTSSIYMLHHTERAPLTELGGDTSLTESGNQEAGLARSFTGQGSVGSDANQSLRNSLLTAAGYSADLDLQRDNNPLRHYLDFITDDTAVNRSEQLVTTYQPGASTEAVKELLVSERNPELESSLSRYLPVFDEILGSSSATNDEDDEFDDEDKDANMFVNFDLNEAIKELKEKEYLTPSVDDDTVPVFPGIPKTVDTAVSLASETRSSSSVSDAVPVANTDVTGVATGVTGVDTDVTGGISRVSTQQVDRQGEAQGIKGGSNALTEEIKGVSNALTEEIKGGSNALTEEMKGGSNALTDLLEEENISGDELFKSGSEMTQAMESLTLAVDKPSTLVGEEKAGTSDSHIVNVNFPIPPMCAPSRGDETILRAQTADLRIAYPKNSNEPTAMIHRPLASTLDIRLSRWNTNTNAGFPADQSTFIAGLSPVSRTLPSSTARQLPPTAEDISRNILKQESDLTKVRPKYPSFYAKPSAMDTLTGNLRQANPPNQSQQQNYPYSFQTERTSQGIIQNLSPYSVSSSSSGQGSSTPTMRSRADSTRLVNPSPDPSHSEHASLYRDNSVSEPHSTATAFRLGSESTSSSSGHEESYKLQGHGKHLTNQNSASSDASVRQFEVSDDDTRSFQTSTPIRKPVKAKQQKDAMNEMLKSYKAQQGITLGRGSAVLNPISDSPDPSAHLSPQEQRRPLHLDVSGNVAPTQRGSQVHHVQSAPVIGQPPLYGDHHRVSKVPKSATPPKEIKRWPSKSPSSASASASPSTRSQFDQQDLAFAEIRGELETHSQHSHSHSESNLHLSLLEREDSQEDEPGEDISLSENEDLARSLILQKYGTDEEERKVSVRFISKSNNEEVVMKFSSCHRPWRDIILEDLCRSAAIHQKFDCQKFCLKFENGTAIDLTQPLGNKDVTVYIVPMSEEDPWFIEGGHIFSN